jgi:hypothetical protein
MSSLARKKIVERVGEGGKNLKSYGNRYLIVESNTPHKQTVRNNNHRSVFWAPRPRLKTKYVFID